MTNRWVAPFLALIALLAGPRVAAAQAAPCPPDHVGCHRADVDFHHRDALFDDVMLDSGWVPPGAAVQVRFAVFLGGSTEVDLGGTAVTSWPPALDVAVPGRPDTGRLAINYGIEIIARIRFDVTVGGVHYTWEGDIPIPGGIPRDLRLADEIVFDPFVLPPSDPRPVLAWDDTERVTVLEVDITDALIPIPGIGGGFVVDAVGALEGSYQTDRIEVSDAVTDILAEGASVTVRPDPGAPELGAAKDLTILPHGTIGYDGLITLYPGLFIEIAGSRFDLTLAEVPLNVVDRSSNTDFDPAMVHVPLPDIRVDQTLLTFGETAVGGASERLLTIHNEGEAELRVGASEVASPFGVGIPTLTIPPRSSARLLVTYVPTENGMASGILLLSSNDPDEPIVTIRLGGDATGGFTDDAAVPLDAGVGPIGPTDGGCGCRAAALASPAPGWLLAIPLAWALRRRRARRGR